MVTLWSRFVGRDWPPLAAVVTTDSGVVRFAARNGLPSSSTTRSRRAIVPSMSAAARLAEFIVKTSLGDCPADAVAQVRRAALDTLGVMLAGASEPVARIVRRVVRAEGGIALATVVGTSLKTSPGWAALANGAAGHAHDFDDTNFALLGHPSVPLLSTALAAAEAEMADGRALVLGYVVGFEVDVALGTALNPDHYTRGWHTTSSIGTLGCTAAAARIMGLDVVQTRNALAIAASHASGLKENFGSMTKPYHAGHVAPDVLAHPRPTTALERKFSMQFCAAAALVEGRVDFGSFTDGEVANPEMRELMGQIAMVVDPGLPEGVEQHAWSRVTVRLRDGRTVSTEARGARGHPDTPLSDAALREKFLGCARTVLGADEAEGVAEQIEHLEDIPDIRALTSRLEGNLD